MTSYIEKNITKNITKSDETSCFISPLNLTLPFIVLLNSAEGNTLTNLQKILGVNQSDKVNQSVSELFEEIKMNNCIICNSTILLRNDFKFRESFLEMAKTFSDIKFIDNGSPSKIEETRVDVNNFIKKNTNGLFPKMVNEGEITKNTNVIVVSALYIKTNWHRSIDWCDFHKEMFSQISGKTEVEYMKCTGKLGYYFNFWLRYSIVKIPFKNNISLVIILPGLFSKYTRTADFHPSEYMSKMKEKYIQIQMPEFEIKCNLTLKDQLKHSETLFDQNTCNLNKMWNSVNNPDIENVYISKIMHSVFLKVNRHGMEGSAATIVYCSVPLSYCSGPKPIKINVNRTFRYQVVYNDSSVIFDGVYNG